MPAQTAPRDHVPAPPDFPCDWADPADAALTWTLERAHWAEPMAPLTFAIAGDALAWGMGSAMRAYGHPVAAMRARRINTYRYQAIVPEEGTADERKALDRRAREEMRAVAPRLKALWRDTWLPEVRAHLSFWERFDLHGASTAALLAHLDETLTRAARLWEIHFLLLLPAKRAIADFTRLYRDLFGEEDALEAYRLQQGFENTTLEMGSALWRLGRQGRAIPAVRRILEETADGEVLPALALLPEGRAFRAGLRAFLRVYGQRGATWSIDTPSWIEDPSPVIGTLRKYMAQGDDAAPPERAATAAERERAVAHARERLRGYPGPVRAQFDALLAAAQEATVLSEDHGFWIDCRAMYRVRRVFMAWGRRFAEAGLLPDPADVFLLTLDELRELARAAAPCTGHALVAERRAEMERYGAIVPPTTLGAAPAPARAGAPAETPGELHGTGGAAGHVRGVARVVRSLSDAAHVRRGDILVAEMTSPAWTPLFATIGAIVTATGGVLSHSAIVAREYRIPAVVGLGSAAGAIVDGQLLEVDGARGIVRLLSMHPAWTPAEHGA